MKKINYLVGWVYEEPSTKEAAKMTDLEFDYYESRPQTAEAGRGGRIFCFDLVEVADQSIIECLNGGRIWVRFNGQLKGFSGSPSL